VSLPEEERKTLREAAEPSRGGRRLLAVLDFLGLVGLLALFAVYAFHAHRVATFPYDMDNGEAYVLNQARLLGEGRLPYEPISEEPYLVANYPPLYPLFLAGPLRLAGLSFAWGRWLSVLSTLGTGILIALFLRRRVGGRYAAALGGLLFFSSRFVYDWTPLHRVDSLALFWTGLGLYLAGARGRRTWGSLAFALALLTRQTMLFAPLAVVLLSLLRRRWREAAGTAVVSFGVPAAVYLALQAASGGEFLRHILYYNVNPYSWAQLRLFGDLLVRYHPLLVVLGVTHLLRGIVRRELDLPGSYVLLAAASFFLAGKVGAASNYMLDLVLALCLAAGSLWGQLVRLPASSSLGSRLLPRVLLGVHLLAGIQIPGGEESAPTPGREAVARARELGRIVHQVEGDCLAEDNGYLLLNGKSVTFQPFIMTQLEAAGIWDPQPLVTSLDAQRYALLILTFDPLRERSVRFSPTVLAAIRRNYEPFRVIAGPGGGLKQPSPWWNYWLCSPRGRAGPDAGSTARPRSRLPAHEPRGRPRARSRRPESPGRTT
jgi:hypothetical protein